MGSGLWAASQRQTRPGVRRVNANSPAGGGTRAAGVMVPRSSETTVGPAACRIGRAWTTTGPVGASMSSTSAPPCAPMAASAASARRRRASRSPRGTRARFAPAGSIHASSWIG
jgi:hypothetical protein